MLNRPECLVLCLSVPLLLMTPVGAIAQGLNFIRSDSDGSGIDDLNDDINTLSELFLGTGNIPCRAAADSNDDGTVDFTDAIHHLEFLFLGINTIPAPYPACGPDPTPDSIPCVFYPACEQTTADCIANPTPECIGHLLNRIGYGPTLDSLERVAAMGIPAYIEEQLDPASIDESSNTALLDRLDGLRTLHLPTSDSDVVASGSAWRLFKGDAPSPAGWNTVPFVDTGWLDATAPVGYGGGGIATTIDDMQGNYTTFYVRHEFSLADPGAAQSGDLILSMQYDDGFVAYLNGVEVARSSNVVGTPDSSSTTNLGHAPTDFEEFDISDHSGLLGSSNVLAIHVINLSVGSNDAFVDARLISREILPGDPLLEYATIDDLKAAQHVRGVYSQRQLQVVLADFWENHFTTDYDKVVAYLEDQSNANGAVAYTEEEAALEAATIEGREYEFFLENALGNFGDLLHFSSESPTMLIYLDNILNIGNNPNENYPREIFELHAFGVDNGYTQVDIEQASLVFTGWNVCNLKTEEAHYPGAPCGVDFIDTEIMGEGPGWKYHKGLSEPTPDHLGLPTIEWASESFNDSTWLDGWTPIGYGLANDVTRLDDMFGNYVSYYMRREFTIDDVSALKSFVLRALYNDGFVAYINGVEVARSTTMESAATPPRYSNVCSERLAQEDWGKYFSFNINHAKSLLHNGVNIFAAQIHNENITDEGTDAAFQLVDREILPGSGLEPGDQGEWSFRFFEEDHSFDTKLMFAGRPYQYLVPAGGNFDSGLAEARTLVDVLVDAAPTAEFICTKLAEHFVSSEPPPDVIADMIGAWNSTTPKGNIATVMRALLYSDAFWAEDAQRAKFKTPLEYLNSSVRVLNGSTTGSLEFNMVDMGQHMFTRDDPDGWPVGRAFISPGQLKSRYSFNQTLAVGLHPDMNWDTSGFLMANGVFTSDAAEIVGFFNDLLYQGTLTQREVDIAVEFLSTDDNGSPQPLVPGTGDYELRVDDTAAFLLGLPHWNFK